MPAQALDILVTWNECHLHMIKKLLCLQIVLWLVVTDRWAQEDHFIEAGINVIECYN
jgi:hypothetical protein